MDNKQISENAEDFENIEIKQEYDICLQEEEYDCTVNAAQDITPKTEYDDLYRDHIIKDEIVIGPEALAQSSPIITLETGFIEGSNCNLPKIDTLMVASFFVRNKDIYAADSRNMKMSRSSRESYGDDAIEYVQLKRELNVCTVKCCVWAQVLAKPHTVTIIVDENNSSVMNAQCHDCGTSDDGYYHAAAFLMWLHRRSEEPSCPQVEYYWRKPEPSKIGTSTKFITTADLGKPRASIPPDISVFNEFVAQAVARGINCPLLKYVTNQTNDLEELSMYQLGLNYREECCEDFIKKISALFTTELLYKVEESTRNQTSSNLWHELRFGRITASVANDVRKCKTNADAIVSLIMADNTSEARAIKRARVLEKKVLQIVQTVLQKKVRKCGLFIAKDFPMIADSPRAILGDQFIIEIKCPLDENSLKKYMHNGKPSNKYYDEIQIKMYVSGYKECYFCVADVDFQNTNNVNIILIQFDEEYVSSLLKSLSLFWKKNVYPVLYKITE